MAYKNIKNIIIGTSCNLFKEKGYHNVSINEICSCCSITKPTFYYHFSSKEEILFARLYAAVEDASASLPHPHCDDMGITLVLSAFNTVYKCMEELGYDFIQNILIGSLKNIDHVINAPNTFHRYMLLLIKKGIRDGSIKASSDPQLIYYSCYHSFLGYMLYWCQHNGLTDEAPSLEKIILTILEGVTKN